MDFAHLLSSLPFDTHIPTDWIIFSVLFIVCLIDGFRSGTSRLAALSLAGPVTLGLASLMPRTFILNPLLTPSNPILHALIFVALFVTASALMHRIVFSLGPGSDSALVIIIASLAVTIISIVVWQQSESLTHFWAFGNQFQSLFGGMYAFWWILISLGGLAYARS